MSEVTLEKLSNLFGSSSNLPQKEESRGICMRMNKGERGEKIGDGVVIDWAPIDWALVISCLIK